MHRRPQLKLIAAVLAGGLAGCSSGSDPVQPAPSASATACADALQHAPASVLGHPRRPLDVTGAAAWGPPQIVLRCGLPEPGPSSDRCLEVDDVAWIVDERGNGVLFTTFGRAPALEVRVPTGVPSTDAPAALVDLAPVAAALPRTAHRCAGAADG